MVESNPYSGNGLKRNGGFTTVRNALAVSACILFGVLIGSISSKNAVGGEQKTSNLRTSTNPSLRSNSATIAANVQRIGGGKTTGSSEDDKAEINTSLSNAKVAIEGETKNELQKNQESLDYAVKTVEGKMKQALEQLLHKDWGISSLQVENLEKEVSKRLKSEVTNELNEEATEIVRAAEEDVKEVVTSELADKLSAKTIKNDVAEMRDFAVDQAKEYVDSVEKSLEDSIRDRAEMIEQEVIKEKLGIDTTKDQLEESEIEAHVSGIKENIIETEEQETANMENDVATAMERMEESMKNVLDSFLKQKGMASAQAKSVEDETSRRFEESIVTKFIDSTEALKDTVDELVDEDLHETVEDDKEIIEMAKRSGMVAKSENQKDVDMIEKDLDKVGKDYDDQIRDTVDVIGNGIKNSMQQMMKNIERDVFQENGVKVSEEELVKLTDIQSTE